MPRHASAFALSAWMIFGFSIAAAEATSNQTYRRNEYAVIRDGEAPNGRLSIAAHGGGELGYDNFHLYLMAEPAHKTLARLEQIGPDLLDTGSDAYKAEWAADSGHVAVLYRADRHILELRLYAIRDRRADPIFGPPLLDAAVKGKPKALADARVNSSSTDLLWRGSTQFVLKERHLFQTGTSKLAQIFGAFGRAIQQPQDGDAEPSYLIEFSAEAVCELRGASRYRIVARKPGQFDQPEPAP